MKIDPLRDTFIVTSERDHSDPLKSHGPIAMETYIGRSNLIEAVKNSKRFSRYGKITICKLVPVGDIEFCEKLIKDQTEGTEV